jgi:predicted Zn-dependent protease
MRLDALEGDSITPTVRATRRRRLGGLALAAGDPSGALPLLEAAYQRDSKDVTLLGWLADARWKTNDASGARTALAEGLALAPRDPALRRLVQTIR